MPRSTVLSNLPHYSADYSKAFDKLKRALCIIIVFIFMFSYLHLFEMHGQVYDKLLRALTASKWEIDILKNKKWLMLVRPPLVSIERGIIQVQSVLGLVILFHPFYIITFVPFSSFFLFCFVSLSPFFHNADIVWFWYGGRKTML